MKRNRLLLGTLYSLIGLSVASLGVTAAWYQSSTQLRVETFEIGVHSSRDLKISASEDIASFAEHTAGYQYDKDSGNYIKKDDASLQLKTQDDFLFKPVTSMYSFEEVWTQDEVPFTKEKKTKPVFYDSYIEGNVKKPMSPSIATSGYFSQELYLLADADCYVTLDPYSCFFNGYTSMDEDKPVIQDIVSMIHKENLKKAKEIHPYEKRGIDDQNVSEDDYYESWADGMDKLYRSLRISSWYLTKKPINTPSWIPSRMVIPTLPQTWTCLWMDIMTGIMTELPKERFSMVISMRVPGTKPFMIRHLEMLRVRMAPSMTRAGILPSMP